MKGIVAFALVAGAAALCAQRERPLAASFEEAGALVAVRDPVPGVEAIDPVLDALVTRTRRRARAAASSELRLEDRGAAPWQRERARRERDRTALLRGPLGDGVER